MVKLANKSTTVIVVTLLVLCYYFDFPCLARSGAVTLESHGAESAGGIAQKNGCEVHHLSPGGGVHVVGISSRKMESTHVGYIEDVDRVQKLKEVGGLGTYLSWPTGARTTSPRLRGSGTT